MVVAVSDGRPTERLRVWRTVKEVVGDGRIVGWNEMGEERYPTVELESGERLEPDDPETELGRFATVYDEKDQPRRKRRVEWPKTRARRTFRWKKLRSASSSDVTGPVLYRNVFGWRCEVVKRN